ncbi:MAG: formate dehydrogenase subunit alpha [Polyangiaceae bacterium]|nr:formate dehydrogenase subunit alpha [Polyangiaceae bacterium]
MLDGREVSASPRATVLDVARRERVHIPTLCYDPRLAPYGACRVCLVGVRGARGPVAACTTPVRDGMVVDTRDPLATKVARGVVELVLSDYPREALERGGDRNELRDVARHFGIADSRFRGERHAYVRDDRHPYLKLDLNECIVCGRCVRACDEQQGTFALAYAGRGWATRIAVGIDDGFADSACVSCGACVATCPTGALDEAAFRASESVDRVVRTTCGYCGVGCGLDVSVRDDRVIAIEPGPDAPANLGHACVKGRFAHQYARAADRLRSPLLRRPDGTWRDAGWDEALGFVAGRLRDLVDRHGPSAVAFVSSSRCTNEENFVLQKLARAALGTNNIDNCSRVCHSPSSYGLIQSFGESGGTNSFADVDLARCCFVTGANPTEAHPVFGARIKAAVLRGAKLIVADPRRIELAAMADVFLQLRPGSNVALYHGLAHVLVRDALVDEAFLATRVDDVEAFRAYIASWDPARSAELTGVAPADLERAAHLYAESSPAGIYYGLGVTEHAHGVDGVRALANLAILTGNLGRRGAGVNPLRGQNNVQGASDVGALPSTFTMYRATTNDAVRSEFEREWGRPLPAARGLMIPEMFTAAIAGSLRALYVFGEDVAQTDPNALHVEQALRALELLVVHDPFENATARLAHAVLPGSTFLEKTGTFTNAERRIQLVRQAVPLPAGVRQDLDVLLELSARLGYPMPATTPAEVMDEIARLTPAWRGVSHARLGTRGLQWPVPAADHPGTEVLFADGRFATPNGRARLCPVEWRPPGEEPTAELPFVLVTGRRLAHYNSGTQTRRTENVTLQPEDPIELHPADAARLGVHEGDRVAIVSARARVEGHASLTTRVALGNVFCAFHFPEMRVNELTSSHADPYVACPEYKVTAVRVERIGPAPSASPRAARAFRPDAHDA